MRPDKIIGPDLDPNCLTLWWYSWKNFWNNWFWKKSADDKKPADDKKCMKKTAKRKDFWRLIIHPWNGLSNRGFCCVFLGYAEGEDRVDHDEDEQDDEIQFGENWEKVSIMQSMDYSWSWIQDFEAESQPQNDELGDLYKKSALKCWIMQKILKKSDSKRWIMQIFIESQPQNAKLCRFQWKVSLKMLNYVDRKKSASKWWIMQIFIKSTS